MRIINLVGVGALLFSNVAAASSFSLHSSVYHKWIHDVRENLEDPRVNINKKDWVNVPQESGAAPLWVAAAKGFDDIAKLLIEHEADLNIKSDDLQTTPLIEACWAGHQKIAILLIEKGADVNAVGKGKDTALMGCATQGLVGAVKILLEHGADANARNSFGMNALMFAAKKDAEEVFAMLLPATSSVLTKDAQGHTVLDYTKGKLLEIIAPRAEMDRIFFDLEELKQYLPPTELTKFLNDLLG